jgi:peptidoglycan/LPS O-acetylase OafA/YrhL
MNASIHNPARSEPAAAGHVPALDGVRGIAILLVLLIHFSMDTLYLSPAGVLYSRFAFAGWIGVDLFFVLSGFLITGILLDAKSDDHRRGADPHYFRNFYARRTLRIFPLYYGSLAFLFIILPRIRPFTHPDLRRIAEHQAWLWLYATNILIFLKKEWFLMSNWFVLNPFWSLAVEEHFYLVWPLVVFLLPRKWLFRLCLATLPACLVLRYATASLWPPYLNTALLTPCRVDSLCFGGLLALLVRSHGATLPALRRAAPSLAAVSFLPLVFLFSQADGTKMTPADFWIQVVGHSLLALCFGFLVLAAATSPPRHPLVRFLSIPFLRSCGKYSYAMYVLHSIFLPWYARFFPVDLYWQILGHQLPAVWLHLAFSTAATFALGWLSWHLFEKHFLKLKRFFIPRRTILVDGGAPVAVLLPTT